MNASPLELREGASLQPLVMADFEYKLQNKEEYTCGINVAWIAWSWTVVPKVPIVRTSVARTVLGEWRFLLVSFGSSSYNLWIIIMHIVIISVVLPATLFMSKHLIRPFVFQITPFDFKSPSLTLLLGCHATKLKLIMTCINYIFLSS